MDDTIIIETLVDILRRLTDYDQRNSPRTYANWLIDGYTETQIRNAIDVADACGVSVQSVLSGMDIT